MNPVSKKLVGPLCSLLLLSAAATSAQSPTPDAGATSTSPLVPAAAESLTVTITGAFAFSNGTIRIDSVTVEPELITVDLATGWAAGTDSAADTVSTTWRFDIDPGLLSESTYDVWIRVNGETLRVDYFMVEAPRVPGGPLPAPTPTVTPRRRLGMNLAPLKDWSTVFTFVDLFKSSREWIPHRISDSTWDTGETIDVDELGWVRSLPPDQEAGTLLLSAMGSAYPGGRYEVTYDGEGLLDFDWDARVIDRAPGWIALWVTPEIGMHVVIRETDPDDYIRNIRIVLPGYDELEAPQPFHPTYVEFLRQFGILRLVDWSAVNEPETNTPESGLWENRITPEHASQGHIRGVALEHIIDLANAVGSDPWISVPVVATDAFVDSMATMVRDRLDPSLIVYVELANEVFNSQFPQHAVAAQRGAALGLADSAAAEPLRWLVPDHLALANALRYQARRSIEVFAIFERVLGRERMFRVLGGWLVDDTGLAISFAEAILDWEDAYQHADGYAVAPYFGFFLAQEEYRERVEAMTVNTILDTAEADLRFMLGIARELEQTVAARSLPLITYEAGHHMVRPTEFPFPSDLVREKLTAAAHHPRMYGLFTELLNTWAEFGGSMNLFNDTMPWGNFGVITRWDQDLDTAHRYRATLDFLSTPTDPEPLEPWPGDGDGDGDVDFDDFGLFADAFGGTDTLFDLDADGAVSFRDLFLFSDRFGTARP
ncbi:MAG TPA: hypothetical protein QGF95_11005 [Candidatus Latescibacteria bacterium]|nr:hypothetical protein [Candidatus Latescibacterota bacterium]